MEATKTIDTVDTDNQQQAQLTETTKNIFFSKTIEITKQALDADEAGKLEQALPLYNRSLDMLFELLKHETNPARKDLFRLKIKELLGRAEEIKAIIARNQSPSAPPIEEDYESQKKKIDQTHGIKDFATIENEISSPAESQMLECDVIINIEGVECYSIVGNDKSMIAHGTLQLVKPKETPDLYILKIGEFEFPLTKSIPCLRNTRCHYIVPMPGNIFYGFVFPNNIPDQYLLIFESKIDQFCVLRKQESEELKAVVQKNEELKIIQQQQSQDIAISTLHKVAQGIETGSKYVAQGIETGGKYLVEGVERSGQFIKSKVNKSETITTVNPKLATSIKIASKVSPVCVKMSRALVSGLVKIAEEVGEAVADSIAETEWGKKMTGPGGRFNGPRTEAAKHVGRVSLGAIVHVWDSLEDAGRKLVHQTKVTTVDVVDHKYGKEAAETTEEGINLAMNVADTIYTVKQVGVKKIAQKVATESGKRTAHKLLSDDNDNNNNDDDDESTDKKRITN